MALFTFVGSKQDEPQDAKLVRGLRFPRDVPVPVADAKLAGKLRTLGCFHESEESAPAAKPARPAKRLLSFGSSVKKVKVKNGKSNSGSPKG